MRVLMIDEHVLFRRCMLAYLNDSKHITEVIGAETKQAALELIRNKQADPEIVLIDADLSNPDDSALVKKIVELTAEAKTVILSEIPAEQQLVQAIKLGATGYINKNIEPDSLIEQLLKIREGEILFPQNVLIQQIRQGSLAEDSAHAAPREIHLTKRETEVLQLVTCGLMDKQIADRLLVSENTVKNHMKSIRKKFGVSNRVQATMAGIEMGVISADLCE